MKQIIYAVVLMVILAAIGEVHAQNRWSIELRNGIASATQNLGNTELSIGYGFDGLVACGFMPHLSAYAGWSWNQFFCKESADGSDIDFEETGYSFGLQFLHPIGNSELSYLLQAGGIFNHIEAENGEGDIIADSGHQLGWEAGCGLAIPMGKHVLFMPNIRYRSLPGKLVFDSVQDNVDLRYYSSGISITWSF